MDERLKQRAVGGVVIVALLVIFVPMFLDFSDEGEPGTTASVVPPKPQAEMQTLEIPLADLQDRQVADALPPPTESDADILGEVMDDVRPQDSGEAPELAAAATAATAVAAAAPSAQPEPAPAKESAPAKSPTTVAKAEAPKSKAAPPKPQLAGPNTGAKAWAVQVGSFTKRDSAEKLRDRLRKSGYRAFVTTAEAGGKTVVRVRVGPELERADADQLRKRIEKELQLQAKVVVHP